MGSNGTLLDFIKKNSRNLAVPTIMLIIGLFFIIKPDGALDITVKVVGVLFVIVGVLLGCSLMAAVSTVSMVLAVALVLIGIICLAASGFVASLILKVIGLCVTVNSIMSIHDAYVVKGKSDNFLAYIINDIITLIVGIVLFFIPTTVASVVVIVLGVILAVLGISNIITVFKVYRDGGRYVDDGSDVVWEE
ncbi:MAG: DUF308 domain-containing protein [Eubacterium sp.]|nr:DUF308 domain-containing protein [Eubacterium sp.]